MMDERPDQVREQYLKTMDTMEEANKSRLKAADDAEIKRKDEAKEEILSHMDEIIPRSERSEITGRSKVFFFPKMYK
jgi:hypothetical protein